MPESQVATVCPLTVPGDLHPAEEGKLMELVFVESVRVCGQWLSVE
jgi:hypothetical protein